MSMGKDTIMDENNNRYSGKRWVSREEMDRQGRSYEKKNGDTGKRDHRSQRDGYRNDATRGERKENTGRYEKKDRGGYGDKKTYTRTDDRSPRKEYDRERNNARSKQTLDENSQAAVNETAQAGGEDVLPFLLIGRNAVREAIKSGRSIDKILVVTERDGSLNEIVSLARDSKLLIRETDRKKLDELCMPFGHGGKTANHQGIVAYAAGMEYCSVADILRAAKEKNEDPFVIVLDGVEDPHNLGSIIRSAECAGAHGVIIGKRRSASVTAAAVKAAAGATAYMKVARVTNISGALEEMKRAGLWIAGADMDGVSMHKQGMNGPLAIVIGGEGGGLTKLVRDNCDFLISIPMWGEINSLNASVAAAVLMFEKKRQDAADGQ